LIDISGLTKIYGNRKVLDTLTLQIPKGEIFGLLEPNGAGKSTTIRMLCTIIKPNSEEAKWEQVILKVYKRYENLTKINYKKEK